LGALTGGLEDYWLDRSLTLLCQRVMFVDQCAKPLLEHMRVDLRGRDVGMAEKLLDNPQIGAVLQEMARKCVPEHMRRNLA
jgi:hypothetical protein